MLQVTAFVCDLHVRNLGFVRNENFSLIMLALVRRARITVVSVNRYQEEGICERKFS